MKVVILAGGKGTRLGKYTVDMPKPMVRIDNKPILQHQIECFKKYGMKDIIIMIGYLGNQIETYFKDGKGYGVNISYIKETKPLGTGGCLYFLKNIIKDDFLLCMGDLMFDIDIRRFIRFHRDNNGMGSLFIHPNDHPYDSDLIITDENMRITGFKSKNRVKNVYTYNNCVNSGIYIFKSQFLKFVTKCKKIDLDKELIQKLIINNEIFYGYKSSEYVKDMGTAERLHRVNSHYLSGIVRKLNLENKQKCIFLDRDGTINKFKGLLNNINDFELEDDVVKAIKLINNSSYICIVITNQPVIARNLCTLQQLEDIHAKMETLLGDQGAYVDDIFYCPHHPDSGYPEENRMYKVECSCRKPDIGLIRKSQCKYNIDLENSFFIGDTTVDIMTGKNAGLKTVLLNTGLKGQDRKYNIEPDYKFDNLYEAIKNVL